MIRVRALRSGLARQSVYRCRCMQNEYTNKVRTINTSLKQAIERALLVCYPEGGSLSNPSDSEEDFPPCDDVSCAVAWDEVEELTKALRDLLDVVDSNTLEPWAPECREYDV